jgi:hypothetical protein
MCVFTVGAVHKIADDGRDRFHHVGGRVDVSWTPHAVRASWGCTRSVAESREMVCQEVVAADSVIRSFADEATFAPIRASAAIRVRGCSSRSLEVAATVTHGRASPCMDLSLRHALCFRLDCCRTVSPAETTQRNTVRGYGLCSDTRSACRHVFAVTPYVGARCPSKPAMLFVRSFPEDKQLRQRSKIT